MPANHWRLRDAKTQFNQVVEAALADEPQHITRRGQPVVVVLSEEAFEDCRRNALAAAPGFIAHLLAMPKAGEENAPDFAPTAVSVVDPFEQGWPPS